MYELLLPNLRAHREAVRTEYFLLTQTNVTRIQVVLSFWKKRFTKVKAFRGIFILERVI